MRRTNDFLSELKDIMILGESFPSKAKDKLDEFVVKLDIDNENGDTEEYDITKIWLDVIDQLRGNLKKASDNVAPSMYKIMREFLEGSISQDSIDELEVKKFVESAFSKD